MVPERGAVTPLSVKKAVTVAIATMGTIRIVTMPAKNLISTSLQLLAA
jgi:hypothetical protein